MKKLLVLFVTVTGSLILLSCGSTDSTTDYQVTLSAVPSEGGTVSPTGGKYEEGKELDISATPADSSWQFDHWSGDYQGTNSSATITVNKAKNIKANFSKKKYDLKINTKGKGNVTQKVIGISSANGYNTGTVVQLTAKPDKGWGFDHWSGDLSGLENPTKITVKEPKEVTAVFEKKSFDVTIKVEGEGSVTISPDQNKYTFGTEIDLTANADKNWKFSKWSGDFEGKENPLTISVDSTITITAEFLNQAGFSGGNGTENDPYQISSIEQLQSINDVGYSSNVKFYFVLVGDIDASETSNWNGNQGFKPINLGYNIFNGKGHKISNLYIKYKHMTNLGLFNSKGSIMNVILANSEIKGTPYSSHVGGLTGFNHGKIKNCKVINVRVGGEYISNVGGIAGINYGTIKNAAAIESDILGYSKGGGLVGENDGQILNSYSTGHVNVQSNAGGLVGQNSGDILNSYSKGSITGSINIGGLLGLNKSYVGFNKCTCEIKNSYATGKIKSVPSSPGQSIKNIGGLVGKVINKEAIIDSYWDKQSTNKFDGIGNVADETDVKIKGLKTIDMSGSNAKENMTGFDFSKFWMTTDSYPILQWQE